MTNIYFALVKMRSIVIDVSVCLFVCPLVQMYFKFCIHVTYGRGSVTLWRQCGTLCNPGFLDDILFLCNTREIGQNQRKHTCSSSSPSGGTGGEVCRLRLHLVNIATLRFLTRAPTGARSFFIVFVRRQCWLLITKSSQRVSVVGGRRERVDNRLRSSC